MADHFNIIEQQLSLLRFTHTMLLTMMLMKMLMMVMVRMMRRRRGTMMMRMMSMAMMTFYNLEERAPDQHARASRRPGVTPSTGNGFDENSDKILNFIHYLQILLEKFTLKRYT